MSERTHPRIAIIGAGLAGLTLARVLQTRSIPFHLYERDASPTSRQTQGGSLDMKLESGQAALKMAGLHEEFKKLMRLEGQEMRIVDKTGFVFWGDDGRGPGGGGEGSGERQGDEQQPEIDRKQLRGIFLDALGEQVRWNHQVTSIEIDPVTHQRTVTFASAPSETYDLVIGADGASSHTRRSIPTATSHAPYTGVLFIETYIEDIVNSHPAQNKTVGHGLLIAMSDGKCLFGQQNGDGTLRVYIALRVPQDFYATCGIPWDKPEEAKERLLKEYFDDWSDDFRSLIQCSNGTFRPWPIYALPVGHNWTHEPGITLIGDAAHVMSPYAGEGANVSMLDGALLGKAISDSLGGDRGIEGAVERFEKEMFERAAGKAKISAMNLEGFMGTREEIEKWVDGFKAMMAAGGPPAGN